MGRLVQPTRTAPPGSLLVYTIQISYYDIYESRALETSRRPCERRRYRAKSLGVSRAEYIRRAIRRMNDETARAKRARDLMRASKKVRAESARVNAEFDGIEADLEA